MHVQNNVLTYSVFTLTVPLLFTHCVIKTYDENESILYMASYSTNLTVTSLTMVPIGLGVRWYMHKHTVIVGDERICMFSCELMKFCKVKFYS